jgi:tetratricopeptide (TPR) repeat protein
MAVSLYEKNRRQKSFSNFNVLSLKTKKENYFFINYKLKMILIIIAIIFGAYSFKYYKQHREKRICFEKDFSFDVYFKEGLRLLELRTYSKSLECFNKAIELNSDYALAFYHKGLVLAHLEKYEESIDNFDKAIDLQPNHVESLYNKALSFYELRNYDKGDECLNKVKELNQDFKIYFKPRRV